MGAYPSQVDPLSLERPSPRVQKDPRVKCLRRDGLIDHRVPHSHDALTIRRDRRSPGHEPHSHSVGHVFSRLGRLWKMPRDRHQSLLQQPALRINFHHRTASPAQVLNGRGKARPIDIHPTTKSHFLLDPLLRPEGVVEPLCGLRYLLARMRKHPRNPKLITDIHGPIDLLPKPAGDSLFHFIPNCWAPVNPMVQGVVLLPAKRTFVAHFVTPVHGLAHRHHSTCSRRLDGSTLLRRE